MYRLLLITAAWLWLALACARGTWLNAADRLPPVICTIDLSRLNRAEQTLAEILEQPAVLGAIYKGWIYDSEHGRMLWHQGKPCVSYRFLLWEPKPEKSPRGVAEAIAQLPADPLHDERSYALINVHAWSFRALGGSMEAVKQCVDLLPPQTRVVTAEQLIILLRNNFGTPVDRDVYESDAAR